MCDNSTPVSDHSGFRLRSMTMSSAGPSGVFLPQWNNIFVDTGNHSKLHYRSPKSRTFSRMRLYDRSLSSRNDTSRFPPYFSSKLSRIM